MDNVRHKIMLVDDNMATLNQGKSLLQPFYKVYTIKSSAILFENLEHYTPDVILLDVEMPEMDGFETITKLKTDARFKDIPVIFLTSKSDEESERKGFSLGAVDYITKPFSGPLLLKRISNQILHKRVQAAAKDYANNVEAMEREIVKAEERIRIMLNATPLCCELWDADFNIIDCNEETVKFFGLSSKQEYIDNVFKFTPEFQSDGERSDEKVVKCLNKALDEGRYVFDWVHLAPDGTMVPVESTLVRVDYKDNYMVAAYSRDLREYKKMMQEINDTSALLESALEQATTASKAKGNFLSTMSHEMRTPMNAIIGMTT
ncbi:MAG: response regulator, partial [Oscillospiraceae bacterium]|nr:response regulator [Oscillospiraceae bacterium]